MVLICIDILKIVLLLIKNDGARNKYEKSDGREWFFTLTDQKYPFKYFLEGTMVGGISDHGSMEGRARNEGLMQRYRTMCVWKGRADLLQSAC